MDNQCTLKFIEGFVESPTALPCEIPCGLCKAASGASPKATNALYHTTHNSTRGLRP